MVQQIVARGELEVLQVFPNFRAAAESIVAADSGGSLTVQEVHQSIMAACQSEQVANAHGYRWRFLSSA
jgi:hypothetical protein